MVRTLAVLEGELGTTLLNRTTRRIHLTDEGRRYLERCRTILAQVQDAEAALHSRRAAPHGRLAMTAPALFGQRYVAPLMTEFLATVPRGERRAAVRGLGGEPGRGRPRRRRAHRPSAVILRSRSPLAECGGWSARAPNTYARMAFPPAGRPARARLRELHRSDATRGVDIPSCPPKVAVPKILTCNQADTA